ncbi:SPFH domain-containing protein [Diplocloster agilis]|uniref:SPFH domain-containing protein n=1 Tax=Diplocloster agilis TaxID=2850323 RepID=UPI000822BD37|nr:MULTISPECIES: SPFH domain-containing protein [Lachnospiraceae]MBU9745606.1 SPFH domain-containing protein [Diplocloster agilis]MCU6732701.1 SPFH domain-containing protein [Suonthocola fibrivorans]SCI57606.1 SPFH domain / Band 7 family [uncultured Clostridium sp.]
MSTKNTGFQEEKVLKAVSGFGMLFLIVLVMIVSILIPALNSTRPVIGPVLWMIGILLFCIAFVFLFGLKVIHPNEALVLTLFGNYYGTLKHDGFFWVNPFCTAINPTAKQPAEQTAAAGTRSGAAAQSVNKKVSLKTMTLNNEKQKVNDELGNPIEIGTVVIWKVKNATKAVMNVENFKDYLSIQCDAITRNAARRYPYDTSEGGDEKSLRGSSQEVADIMKQELQEKVEDAGISILEVRITHLSYAPEIASAMLQRQQAAAIIDARQKIVEGAVSMVEMALSKLNDTQIVELDEERKAAMVSNLLVILCGNKDAQPIVNSGSLY